MPWLTALLLLIPYFGFAATREVDALRMFFNRRLRGGLLAALFVLPYLFAVFPEVITDPAEVVGDLARIIAYIFIPTLALLYRPPGRKPLDVFDIAAIIALWFPIEFDWLPGVSARLAVGVNLPVSLLIGVDLAFLLFLVIRPLHIGYSFRLTRHDLLRALQALAAFAAIGLPLGLAIRFLAFGLSPFQPAEWLLKFLAIYLLTGIPEELLFRGIIQNLVEQRFGRGWPTLIAASLIFGAAHLNNATTGYAAPNFAYMLMATLAGIAYGWVWRQTGKITAAAITHASADWIWGVVFGG